MEKFFPTAQVALAFLLLGLAGPLFSQKTDSLWEARTAEVIVSSSRNAQAASEAPRSVTVLGAGEIARLPFVNIGELLSQQYGIYVTGAGQVPGQLQTLFMRGMAGNQTAIFVDGIRIYDAASADASMYLTELSLANVERVEIVRGGHSALFGSAAIGGMVNIVTKKNGLQGLHAQLEGNVGSFGKSTSFFKEEATLRYGSARGFYVALGLGGTTVRGLDATVDTVSGGQRFPQRDADNFSDLNYFVKTGFQHKKWDTYLSWRQVHQKAGLDDGAFTDDSNFNTDFDRQLFNYFLKYQANERFSIEANLGFTQMTRSATDDSSFVAPGVNDQTFSTGRYTGFTANEELQAVFSRDKKRYTLGAFMQAERMSAHTSLYANSPFGAYFLETNLDSLDLNTTTAGVFAEAELQKGFWAAQPAFSLTLAGRLARHSVFGPVFTFNLAPAWHLDERSLLFLSLSSGFNAPSLYQLYSPEADFVSNVTRGNPDLKPERSLTTELGIRQDGRRFSWSASLFQTNVQNAIQYVFLWENTQRPDTLGYLDYRGDTYINAGKQRVFGLEMSLKYHVGARWAMGGNVSLIKGYLDTQIWENGDTHVQNYLPQLYNTGAFLNQNSRSKGLVRRPHTANAFIEWLPFLAREKGLSRMSLRMNARYAGARKDAFFDYSLGGFGALGRADVRQYLLTDAQVTLPFTARLRAILRMENLFDTQYSEILGYTTRGRSFYATVRFAI